MKVLKIRINNLLQKTTTEAVREQANLVLNMIEQDGDQKTLLKLLIEKIESIDVNVLTDIDKKFVLSERKMELLETLQLHQIFNSIQGNFEIMKANPQLPYILEQLRTTFESGQQQAVMIAESLLNVFSKFTFIPAIDQQYTQLTKIVNENQEDLSIIKTINSLNYINREFYNDLIESLELYIYDKDLMSRSQLFEQVRKYEFEPVVKEFANKLAKYGAQDGLSIINENKNFNVYPVYSFITINENNKIIFSCAGNYYEKYNNDLIKLNESEIETLTDTFKQINNYLLRANTVINESGMNIFIGSDKITLKSANDNTVIMYLNENEIKLSNPYQYLMQSGVFKYDQADELQIINNIYENFHTLINIDFAKAIVSSINEGFGTVLFKLNDEKFYLHEINPIMRINEFKENVNAVQVRNELLEFMNYDISESLYEFMDKTQQKIGDYKTQQSLITEEIQKLNVQLTKVEQAELDILTGEKVKSLHLKEAIVKEINQLKDNWRVFESKINKLQKHQQVEKEQINETCCKPGDTVKVNGEVGQVLSIKGKKIIVTTSTSDSDGTEYDESEVSPVNESESESITSKMPDTDKLIPNKQVRLKNSGVTGKIAAVNTPNKEVTIITDEGDTINCPFEQIELIEDTIAKNAEELQAKAKEVEDVITTNNSQNESLKKN